MELPKELQKKITDYIGRLPNIHDSDAQKALLSMSRLPQEVQAHINTGRAPALFASSLTEYLIAYGKLDDEEYAIEVLLEATNGLVGRDKQIFCESLLNNNVS